MNSMISRAGAALSIVVMVLFTGVTVYLHARHQAGSIYNVRLSDLPMQIGSWKGETADPMTAKAHDILKLDQYVRRMYRNDAGDQVFVYIGYWEKQSGEHQAAKHSPLMCLPANGWKISSPELRSVPLQSSSDAQPARQLVGVISDTSVVFYYWFFSGEENYVDETDALFHIMHETIVKGRSDGGIVELSLQIDQSKSGDETIKEAEAALQSFVAEFAPALRELVAKKK